MAEYEISANKKAFHNYDLQERFEAGLVLTGDEIKAVRERKVNLAGSFARLTYNTSSRNPELVVLNLHIGAGPEPTRTRKLLMKREEINRLIGKIQEKGLTLVPVRIYLKRSFAKLELALAKGRKIHDKRERLKRKHRQRELDREMSS